MENLTKETFEKIVKLLKQLIDTHTESYERHKNDYNDEVVGYRLRIENTEGGRIGVFLGGYLFHPIKGAVRPHVRKEFAEFDFSYPLPPGYPPTHAQEIDTYILFSDGVIIHHHQNLEMHIDENGNSSYGIDLGHLKEKDGQELIVHLENILEEEELRGLIKKDKLMN